MRLRPAMIPVLMSLLLLSVSVYGQHASGSILGTVSDSNGAVVSDVSIKITNTGTGLVRETVTNESGNYRVDDLPIGTYTVESEAVSFKKEVRSGIQLDIGARARVDVALKFSGAAEQVATVSDVPAIQTDDAMSAQVVDERIAITLPLNGRDVTQLATIVPGTFTSRPGSSLAGLGGIAVAGLNENTNQVLLDGINDNGTGTMEIAARINPDAIGELKVLTGNYPAQYGRYAGAQIEVATKSGSNGLHGAGFGFVRNDNVDARNVFDPYPLASLPEFRRYQYGLTVGGPIVKDKLFYFAGYQGQRQAMFETTAPTVPLTTFWSGNLSQMPQIATDPNTGLPFPGNQIPSNRIHPISAMFRPYWPIATKNTLFQNASADLAQPDNFSQPNGRIDWIINPEHSLNVSYNYVYDRLKELAAVGNPDVPGFASDTRVAAQALSFSETWIVNPDVVNQFRAGFGRLRRNRMQENGSQNLNAAFGILGTTADTEPQAWGLPYVAISGFSRIGDNTNMPQPRTHQSWTMGDTVSIVKGNHGIKVGTDYFLQQMNLVIFNDARGAFNFDGSRTGNPFADFLLGLPSMSQRQPPLAPLNANPRRTSINGFVQDDWRAMRDFTMSFGLRYEYTGHLREKFGKLSAFDPTLNKGLGGIRMVGDSPLWDNAVATLQGLYPSLTIVRESDQLSRNNGHGLAPRIGMAIALADNTAVRGAYGIFYSMDTLCNCDFYSQAPFNLTQTFTAADGISWDNPWGVATGTGITMSGIDPNLAEPYYQHWNVDLQHQTIAGILVDFSYQGRKGSKLARSRDINQPLKPQISSVRPYANFGSIAYVEGSGSSIYHGIQTRVEKRTSHGQSFLVSYMFGKMIDDVTTTPQNSYNLRAERALSSDDVRHRLSASFIAALPFGPNQRFHQGLHGVSRGLFAGWEFAGIIRANSGSPLTPTLSIARSGTGNAGWDRPNLVGNPKLAKPTAQGWWNTSAFALPAAGTFGSAGRNILIGPGAMNVDASLVKNVYVKDSHDIQVRFEFFNALNHANFNNPLSTSTDSTNFGVVSSALPSRQIQVGLKYLF